MTRAVLALDWAVAVYRASRHVGLEHTREVDGAVVISIDLVDHILQLRFGRVLTQGSHNGAELLGGDLSWILTSVMCSAIETIMTHLLAAEASRRG